MARERKKRAGDSAYSKRKTATAESSSDRDDNEDTDAKSSPRENGGNKFGRSVHKKKGRSQQSS